jgi:predicted mannosyl-3-phosphoglycerate phosphatase (HAD superfamily)
MTPVGVPRWVLFADIDGTLWCGGERRDTLRRRLIRATGRARVVLASSRTIEEILELQTWTGVQTDFLAENGAQLVTRDARLAGELPGCDQVPASGSLFAKSLADPLGDLLPAVAEAARRYRVARHLAAAPGWPGAPASASSPPPRRASLLLPRTMFGDGAHAGFVRAVRAAGLEVVHGGEWTTISRGASKGQAARHYLEAARRLSARPIRTAAIGNSDNDASLLCAVERPFVVRNPGGHAEALSEIPGVRLLSRPACAGWYEALERLNDR